MVIAFTSVGFDGAVAVPGSLSAMCMVASPESPKIVGHGLSWEHGAGEMTFVITSEISVLAGIVSIEDIKTEMQRVLQIDEGYQSGSAYMVLGQVYLATPRLMGGNAQEAVDYLEKGLRFAADNTPLHVRLAEAYLAVNRKDDARKQLAVALSIKPNPDYIPEHKHAVEQAHQLEEKLK